MPPAAVDRLVRGRGDDHALAGGEPVGLHHQWVLDLTGSQVGLRRAELVEIAVRGGRNAVPVHQLLGKQLGSFDPGGRGRGSEDGDARIAQPVADTGDERRLGADDDEVVSFGDGVLDQLVGFAGADGDPFTVLLDARAAGRQAQQLQLRATVDRPGQGVLAAPAADQQDSHGLASRGKRELFHAPFPRVNLGRRCSRSRERPGGQAEAAFFVELESLEELEESEELDEPDEPEEPEPPVFFPAP